MNSLPVPANRPFEPGRASGLVTALTPARKTPDPTSESGQTPRIPATPALDGGEREVLMERYAESLGPGSQQLVRGQNAQRAISAYNEVASGNERDELKTMLGINEYA